MNKYLHMIIVLSVVALLSGASLAMVYNNTKPLIEENQRKALKRAILKIVKGAERYKAMTKNGEAFYEVYNKKNKLVGYAFMAEGNGYQGKIKMISGIKKDLSTIYGIEILESIETPGLGGEIVSEGFRGQFKGLQFSPKIECVKRSKEKNNEIQAITGATISSQKVVSILNKKAERVVRAIKK